MSKVSPSFLGYGNGGLPLSLSPAETFGAAASHNTPSDASRYEMKLRSAYTVGYARHLRRPRLGGFFCLFRNNPRACGQTN
jgi:hypothetical protein